MRKIIFCLTAFLITMAACKKNKEDNLSCDELKKRMEQKGDEFKLSDKASCKAYVDAIRAYAKAKCVPEGERIAFEITADGFSSLCN